MNSNEENIEVKAIAKGLVQGVGFRASLRNVARSLKLFGSAKNLRNGSVEIYIQGNRASIDHFIQEIRDNRVAGNVIELLVEEVTPQHHYESFLIF